MKIQMEIIGLPSLSIGTCDCHIIHGEDPMSSNANVRYAGNVAIIDLAGRIVYAAGSGALRDAIKRELDVGQRNILLNLNGVDYMDSAGLGEMAWAYVTLAKMGGTLRLVNTQSRVNNLLQITRLYKVFVTFAD